MTTVYIDPSALANGTGTAASPYNTWASVPTGAGVIYKQKRGTTWTGSFPSLTSGTSGNVTTITAYANADGSDDPTLPLPIIDIGDTIMPGTVNSPRTFTKWSFVDIRCNRSTIAGDTPIMWLGSDVEISDCSLTSNLTALYGEKCSRVQILRNKITCATAITTTAAINAIVLGGSLALDNNVIDGNQIYVGDSGRAGVHAIKVAAAVPITSIQITNNTIRTVSGQMCTHADKAGIYINNGAGAGLFGSTGTVAATIVISGNDVANLADGVFLASVCGAWVHHNTLDHCGSFGLHVTGNSSLPSAACLLEWNKCRWAGRNLSPFYGRGIELSGAGQLDACTGHVVRFNDASYAKNWGGPVDNATEGVGIGLDDATSCCLVYGNLIRQTEGNGIQFYGGASAPSDTGGNMVIGNHIIDCGLGSYKNRRTSPVALGMAAIGLSKTTGSRTVIAYNTIIGGTGGVRPDSFCSGVEIFGNAFKRQTKYAVATALAVSRASVATYYDSTGALVTAPADTLRMTCDPSNLAAAPTALVEPAATNYIRNNTMAGAVAGTPGATPTNWSAAGNSGLSRQVIGTGLEDGIPYIDVRVFGTCAAVAVPEFSIMFDSGNVIAATSGQAWTSTFYVRVVGGSTAGLSNCENFVIGFTSGATLAEASSGVFFPTSGTLKDSRNRYTFALASGTTAYVVNRFDLNFQAGGGMPIDITVRIGLPQLEKAAFATSPIKTSGAAVTRAADLIQGMRDNVYDPSIPLQVGDLSSDANGSPAPKSLTIKGQGDVATDPLVDDSFVALAGSPLLDKLFRNGVPFAPLMLDLAA